ncbi:MAG: 50S ribosomal protein L4 [Myxococcota bacterium]|jgi:large subunit ribosomal protein L4|nr:50S ribosomal protein L4 [Myxococcota bacterium]
MANIDVINLQGETVGSVELDDAIFGAEVKPHLHWEVVRWQRAKTRAGTHLVKTKSERSGTGAKPYRQKGTGNARQGSRRSVQFVGGGRVHGPQPRDYSFSVNKKARRAALRSVLSQRFAENKLVVVKAFDLETPKTKQLNAVLGVIGAQNAVLVGDSSNENLRLSARNLQGVETLNAEGLNVYSVLGHDKLVISEAALKDIERRLA